MLSTDCPEGWQTNPSSLQERIPLVFLALIGFSIAAYMALYQYGVIGSVWDPFFGDGTRRVLNSHLSGILPVKDAALGAFGYLLDVVTGLIGGRRRWATMPWIVVLFGIAVGPLGLVSVLLVIAQPTLVGAWCSLCLLSAFISILMIGPAMDEVLASLQFLQRRRRSGQSLWRAFWGLSENGPTAFNEPSFGKG